ncbi:MAG: tRNA pseudouridine(38-40) synthase TruA [Euryarchaeota archaeon]|nr:tRNA pseudouridine(38-40) synthase TruA [Euryarchaeota archaeon]
MTNKTRIALKLSYIGDRYHGFQIQQNAHAIESEIFASLEKNNIVHGIREARYSSAARTDRGVHASGQVIAFDTSAGFGDSLPRIINHDLPDDIWAWAYAEVPYGFDARRDAVRRDYRYYLYDRGYDVLAMTESSQLFTGTHDFSNFARKIEGVVSTINKIKVCERDGFIIIDVSAPSFLWNMVRRIAAALEQIGAGLQDSGWIEELLDPKQHPIHQGLQPAPAYGLVLQSVAFEGVEWIEDEYSKRVMEDAFVGVRIRHATMNAIYSGL